MLDKAEHSRYHCTECMQYIKKGEKYFRDAKSGWRSSHTVNICWKCLTKAFFELNISARDTAKLKIEFLAEAILGTQNGKK
jgi:RNase P subunit RPR2